MRSVCFYFQVHQPFRLRTFRFFDIGKYHNYYDEYLNKSIVQRVASKSYLPANKIILKLIKKYGEKFKVSYSISGIALDQFERYAPEVITSFKALAKTNSVEFLVETDAHSLASLKSKSEFIRQVKQHSDRLEKLFGKKPTTFRNTELIYSDEIGAMIADLGYEIMLTEGAKHILGWKSPNYMYSNAINPGLRLLLRNFRLSDDIAFRFSLQSWSEWPLTTEKFADWLNALDRKEQVVNLFIDYETFGEHQWEETGIFEFLSELPEAIFKRTNYVFSTPEELSKKLNPIAAIHVPHTVSWADEERDLTAWLGNELQDEAFENLYALEEKVNRINDPGIMRDWRYLQASDHLYYMCTKWFSDGDVHKYFNPYPSPYEAFINYMNVLSDFQNRLNEYDRGEQVKTEIKEEPEKKKQARTLKRKASGKIAKITSVNQITDLSNAKIKQLIKNIDPDVFACALLDAGDDVMKKVQENMGKRYQLKFEALSISKLKAKKTEITRCRKLLLDSVNELLKK